MSLEKSDTLDGPPQPLVKSGVVFVATGAKYIACAEAAARSVRRHMPEVPIALFTNAGQLGVTLSEVFDPVIELESVHHRSKVDCLMNSPFEKTLFLDADIRVLEDVSELFDLLERFDMAMAPATATRRGLFGRRRCQIPFLSLTLVLLPYDGMQRRKRFCKIGQTATRQQVSARTRSPCESFCGLRICVLLRFHRNTIFGIRKICGFGANEKPGPESAISVGIRSRNEATG